MTVGPRPSFQVPEARRAEDDAVVLSNDREPNGGVGVPPSESGVDVNRGRDLASRDGAPLIEVGIVASGGDKTFDVAMVKWFEANVFAGECDGLSRHCL